MLRAHRLLLAAVAMTAAVTLAAGTAAARRLGLSNQAFQMVWELLRFEMSFTGELTCPVTLEGSFHSRTLSKVCGQLVGYITKAQSVNTEPPCRNGTASMLGATLPWHIQYVSFAGTLPSITEIKVQIVGMSYRLTTGSGFNCLIRTTAEHPYVGIFHRDTRTQLITEFRSDESVAIPVRMEGTCSLEGTAKITGATEVHVPGTTTKIRVELVQ
jgi:hypothetical protein